MECKLQFLLVAALHEIWLKLQFAPGAILRDRGELLENGVENGKHSGKLSSGSEAFSFFIYLFLLKPVFFPSFNKYVIVIYISTRRSIMTFSLLSRLIRQLTQVRGVAPFCLTGRLRLGKMEDQPKVNKR